jgi:hypothetical protein
MKRPVKLANASLKALGIVVALGAAAHASLPYLPMIGPPAMRVLVSKSPNAAVVKLAPSATATATNLLAAVEAKTFPGLTNATSSDAGVTSGALTGLNPERSLEDTYSASVFSLPTPDLLSLTPQMLAAYFHPVRTGTNIGALNGPFHVSFMPPLPPPPAPGKSSHAEYIVK